MAEYDLIGLNKDIPGITQRLQGIPTGDIGRVDGSLQVGENINGVDADSVVNLRAALANSSSGNGADLVSFDLNLLGSVIRTVTQKGADIISVKDFGAIGDGDSHPLSEFFDTLAEAQVKYPFVTSLSDEIDWAASQAVVNVTSSWERKAIYFPAGVYMLSAPIECIDWSCGVLFGEGCGASILKTMVDDDIIQLNPLTGSMTRGMICNLGFDRVFTLPYTNSCGIHVVSTIDTRGLYAWKFQNLQFQHLYRCIRFGPTEKEIFNGVPSIERHSFCEFLNIKVLASTAFQPYQCILFDQGCGPHHTISGGNLFAVGAGSSCIKIGDGGLNNGFGDMLIYGVHLTDAENGVELVGPTGVGIYNQNISIVVCQFDGATMQNAVAATRMQNLRILPNNSSSLAQVLLNDCDNVAMGDEQNNFFYPALIAGAHTRTSNGVTFATTFQAHSQIGYVMDTLEWSNDTLGTIKMIGKSRGASIGAQAAVQGGDRISEDRYIASNGTAFIPGAGSYFDVVTTPGGSDSFIATKWELRTSPGGSSPLVARIIADEAGNVALAGAGVSTATSATNGFIYMQKSLGAPTGIPAKTYGGRVPVLIDETNSRFYAYNSGAWKYGGLYTVDLITTGTATITNPATSTTVTHSLGATPAAGSITITPTNSEAGATTFYIANITSTTFDIVVGATPATSATYGWSGRRRA